MISSLLLALALLACGGGAADAAHVQARRPDHGPAQAGRRCGTEEPSLADIERCRERCRLYAGSTGTQPRGGEIAVSVHVLTCRGTGSVPRSRIDAQIDELNRSFAGAGFHFHLARVEEHDDCGWFGMTPGSATERDAKRALADDPAHRLNLYLASPGQSLLGWAYFPDSYPEDDPMHGVVVHYGSLPGGVLPSFDLGRTAVHEVGHYLGLYHTFQNGCEEPGDDVADTPYEATPALGCPTNRNTCEQPGDDPVNNYMDYSDDACTSRFTPGQIERMNQVVPVDRPSLIGAPPVASRPLRPGIGSPFSARAGAERHSEVGLQGAVWLQDAVPNPTSDQAVLSFSIARAGHVSLRVYDAAGHRVGTLIDRDLDAGVHAVTWQSATRSPGLYTIVLKALGVTERRIVMVEPGAASVE